MRRPDMAGKISFLRRIRRTIGYAGRYLFPCPLSAGLSPLFSSALVTFFPLLLIPSSPSFFAPISPFRFYPATGVSSCFIASFLLSVIVSTAPLCLSSAHFLPHFFSAAPHSSCLHHIRFPPFLFLSLPLSPLYRPSFARRYQPSSPLTSIGRFSASSALFL